MVFYIWKKDMIKLLKIYLQKARFNEDYMEVYENRADPVSNNLRLNEISILTFFQLYCKINRNKSEIFVEETYDVHPN